MGEKLLDRRGYGRLLRQLREVLGHGQREAELAVGQVLAETYWEVGQRILREELSGRAGYGRGIVEELGLDLGLSRTVMFQIVAFARAYPHKPGAGRQGLGWSQYVELLAVKSEAGRQWYEERAVSEGWSRRALQQEVRRGAFALAEDVDGGVLLGKGRRGSRQLARPVDGTFVYGVTVTRVIDGDTVVVEIDLGFDVIRRQKMRLAGMDAGERGTAEGRAATRFVRERLARAEVVAVKTVRREDVHGRYVGHLFYSTTAATADETFRTGHHLNAEIVREGHAVVVRG